MLEKHIETYIKRCFDLACLGKGSTSPNPSVGCVIVYNNQIIGEGWTQPFGGHHAEVQAIASVSSENRQFLKKSTAFVTLEPCSHFGATPPCADLLVREKIPNVYVAFEDPNPKVSGKGIEKLQLNGIEVSVLFLNNKCKYNTIFNDLNTLRPFFTNILQQRPFIILKWAESADGFISKKGNQVQISNNISKRVVHKWRSECDGIMVGTQTAETDNPALNNRFYFGKSPVRIVFDRTARLSNMLQVFDKSIKTIIYTENTEEGTRSDSKDANLQIRNVKFDDTLLYTILKDLLSQKIGILLVEGGQVLLNSFIEKNLWDEARIIRSKSLLNDGIDAPKLKNAQLKQLVKIDDNTVSFYENI